MYGKIFAQMYDGTLATRGPWQALVTFQQLIVLANKHGEVDMTAEAISRRTTVPLEIISEGLKRLQEPDPDSRSPELDGRRIVPLAEHRKWGWRIVNYEAYNKIRSQEERREYHHQYYHKRKNVETQHSTTHSTNSTESTAIDVDVAVDLKATTLAQASRLSLNGSEEIPLKGGESWQIPAEFLAELERLCPRVDAVMTLQEIRLWCLGNEDRQKTRRGVKRFVARWFAKEQEKANAQA